jgi:adenylate cyclase
MESLCAYIPIDRYHALVAGRDLPSHTRGTALFADISGFTPLTEALTRELGPQRGAEELTRQLNLVYDALTFELNSHRGSVVSFSGDAITCWFDKDDGCRATTCALAMQQAMQSFATVTIPSGKQTAAVLPLSLAMKAAVATGVARRFLVGDPQIQIIDVLAGALLDQLSLAEHHASRGEVILAPSTLDALGDNAEVMAWREDEHGHGFGVVSGLRYPAEASPWPPLPSDALDDALLRSWLLPPVYERLCSGQGDFLAELRPAVALFLQFGGIDYDTDEAAQIKLDTYIRATQKIVSSYEGALLQLSIGDKGSYLYAAFGAPLAHEDDAARAAAVALELRATTGEFDFVDCVQIGISQGRMRTGAYGGTLRRTYGVIGDDVNLAARLMQFAASGQILANKVAYQASAGAFEWEQLPDISVKGKAEPVPVFSLVGRKARRTSPLLEARYALPMVGREDELALIGEKLTLAQQSHGQIIGITGEAGMGKSRLVAEAFRIANDWQFCSYDGECQSYGTHTSYLVWGSIWSAFFNLDPGWPVEQQIAHLEEELTQLDPALAPRLPLLGAVLNLPIPENDLTGSFDAKLRKTSLESLLVDCLRAQVHATGASVPLLLVLEECHWLDPLSEDLLEVIGRAIGNLPVLIIMAYRPPELTRTQAPSVSRLPHFTEIGLRDFTPQEAERLIELKLATAFRSSAPPPRVLVERITARAQGNPFYIEELLNYLQDSGIDPDDSQALQQLDLPTSLHSLILTRIDTLTESQKATLRVASVIGGLPLPR